MKDELKRLKEEWDHRLEAAIEESNTKLNAESPSKDQVSSLTEELRAKQAELEDLDRQRAGLEK